MEILKISKAALENKVFGRTEAQIRERFSGDELEKELQTLPTEDEANWMRVYESTAAGLERLKRKMSICVFAEIETINENGFSYRYADKLVEVVAPHNSLKVSEALDKGRHAAVQVMCEQGSIKVNSQLLDLKKGTMSVDEIQLLVSLTYLFFFQTSAG